MRNHTSSLLLFSAVTLWTLSVSTVLAAGVPEITKIDATLLQDKVAVSLSWKSDAPITEIRATGGKEIKYITAGAGNTMETIVNKFNGGPVGIASLAVSVGEERDTIEEVYEPYLIQAGYLTRTTRGRVATRQAFIRFSTGADSYESPLFDAKPDR